MTTTRTTSALLAGLAGFGLLAAPSLVWGQQRAGGEGRALDANQQVGSGGTNSSTGQTPLDLRLRNSVVTGNAGAGQSLQIDRPYLAPNEFQGNLGSDDLFQFNRDAIQSAPQVLSGPRNSVNMSNAPVVFRSFSSFPPSGGAYDALSSPRIIPFGGQTNMSSLGTGAVLRQQNQYTQIGTASGVAPQPGRALDVIASPLLGFRQTPQTAPLGEDLSRVNQAPLAPRALDRPENPFSAESGDPELRVPGRLDLPRYDPLLAGQDKGDRDPNQPSTFGATTILGRQLQPGRLGSERGDRPDASTQQRVDRIGESLMNRAAQVQQQGEQTPYSRILDAVQNGRNQQGQTNRPGQPGQTGQPGQPGEQPRPGDPTGQPGQRPGAGLELVVPDDDEVQRVEEQRSEALRRAYGLPQRDAATAQQTDEPNVQQSVQELLDRLNYDLPALNTLAGDGEGRRVQQMKEAEAELASGRYFEAERVYRQVLGATPNDPLARIGLIHSQLGAGLIRSAALNLRSLFEQNPEVIAARYEKNLLPDQDRLNWVRGELERMLDSPEGGADAAIMLAYLGYQVESRQLVRYGLATAQARAPRDTLVPVLRHIWLDQGATEADSTGATTPAAPPTGGTGVGANSPDAARPADLEQQQ